MTPKQKNERFFANLAGTAALAFMLAITPSAHAMRFSNQFIEFELPNKWKCQLEGAEWVCQSEDSSKKKEAIIVLAAKLKGEQDTLDAYEAYLKKPRAFSSAGKSVTSQPKYVDKKTINQQIWIDSMHLESEVPGFFTRYLATIKEDIGVLVTYSVDKPKWSDYQKEFESMVSSLKVFRKPKAQVAAANSDLMSQSHGVTAAMLTPPLDPNAGSAPLPQARETKSKATNPGGSLGLIVLLAAAGGFFIWKKKKQNS